MRIFKKVISTVLTGSILFGVIGLTGCEKLKQLTNTPAGTAVKIAETDPWFDSTRVQLDTGYEDNDEVEYMSMQNIMVTDDSFVMYLYGMWKTSEADIEDPSFDYTDYMISEIAWYSLDGVKQDTLDFSSLQILDDNGNPYAACQVDNAKEFGGNVVISYSCYDETYMSKVLYEVTVDSQTHELGEPVKVESNLAENEYAENSVEVGDGYILQTVWMSPEGDENSSYKFYITDPSGNTTIIDMSREFPEDNIYDISTFINVSETEVLLPASMDGSDDTCYMLNLDTFEVTKVDMQWLSDANVSFWNLTTLPDGGCFICDEDGIKKVDFENEEIVDVLDYGACNVDRSEVSYASLLSYDGSSVVMMGTTSENVGTTYRETSFIYTYTPAETNPNAGKTILSIATLDNWSAALYTAIYNFNQTSSDYYVIPTNEYSASEYYESQDYEDNEDTDYQARALEIKSTVSNQLAIDIMAGEGPDIIVNGSSYAQLNNPDYLIDMNTYLNGEDGVSRDQMFTNIVDAAQTGDALYNVPLTYSMEGILALQDTLEEGQVGFTFDQIVEFIDEECNGSNPLQNFSRNEAFIYCFSAMSDVFVDSDGKLNLDNDDFVNLVNFCRDNFLETVPEDIYEDSMYYVEGATTFQPTLQNLYNIDSYLSSYAYGANDGTAILCGLPSNDGRGPVATIEYSAGISAQSASADGAWSFVKSLLSEEAQIDFESDYSNPILISAFDATAQESLDSYNDSIETNAAYYTEEEAREYGIRVDPIPDTVIDDYRGIIESISSVSGMDSAVGSILLEELPAYFEGQKTIDEVISIITSRAQTIIDERG